MITAEHLVGALSTLYRPAFPGHFPGEQIEADAVVADHGLRHGGNRRGKLTQQLCRGYVDLVVAGAELRGHDIGVLELVALFTPDGFKADGKGVQALGAGLGHQAHQQAGVDAPDSSTPTSTAASWRLRTARRNSASRPSRQSSKLRCSSSRSRSNDSCQ